MKDMGVKNVKNISGGIAEWNKIKNKTFFKNIDVFFNLIVKVILNKNKF